MGVALLAAAQERGASWPSDIDLWLLFWALCAVVYGILILVQRPNRTRAGLKTAVSGIWPPSWSTVWDGGFIATSCGLFPASSPGCGSSAGCPSGWFCFWQP